MREKNLSGWILIAVGLYFLASNLGFLDGNIKAFLKTWWPVIPLVIGVGVMLGKR